MLRYHCSAFSVGTEMSQGVAGCEKEFNHKELNVWKEGINFVTEIYKTTKSFPKEELYGITSQIRRTAVSILSNIAEGAARKSKKELSQFL